MPAGGMGTAAAVGGLVALGGSAAAALSGLGKSEYQPDDWRGVYNPTAGDVNNGWGRYGRLGDSVAQRGAIPVQTSDVQDAQQLGAQSRYDQQQALLLMQRRALGEGGPSIAELQGQQQLQTALAQQQAQVASVRGGPGAQAAAARGAMLAGAQMRGDVAGQTAVAAAQERLAAQQAYLGGATGMRGQDQSMQGLNQQWALGQGQLALGSRAQNDAQQLGLYGLSNQAALGEAQGRVASQGQALGAQQVANQLRMQQDQYNSNRDMDYFKMAIGGASGALGSMAGGGK